MPTRDLFNGTRLSLGTALNLGAIVVVLAFVSWLWGNFTTQIDVKVEPIHKDIEHIERELDRGASHLEEQRRMVESLTDRVAHLEAKCGCVKVPDGH